jgi:hypothetical protein
MFDYVSIVGRAVECQGNQAGEWAEVPNGLGIFFSSLRPQKKLNSDGLDAEGKRWWAPGPK